MWNPAVLIQPISPCPEPLTRRHADVLHLRARLGRARNIAAPSSIWHGGAVFGSLAAVVLLPDRNVGFYIAVNSEEGADGPRPDVRAARPLSRPAARRTGPRSSPPSGTAGSRRAIAALQAPAAQPARVGPSLPLARYAGDYADPWYGTINDPRAGRQARTSTFPHSPGLTATLDHWQYDTFRTRFNDPGMEPAYVTFQLDAQGHVDRISMRAVSPIADFSFDYQDLLFTPVAATR